MGRGGYTDRKAVPARFPATLIGSWAFDAEAEWLRLVAPHARRAQARDPAGRPCDAGAAERT